MRISMVILVLSSALFLPVGAATAAFTTTLNPGTRGGVFAIPSRNATEITSYHSAFVLPDSYTDSVVSGGASSTSEYDYTNDGFLITFTQSREGNEGGSGQSNGQVHFSVDQNVDYEASGFYASVDLDGRELQLSLSLYDWDLGAFVFKSFQYSQTTVNESFTLGGSGGDYGNENFGSLLGTLLAGHNYQLNYGVSLRTISIDPTGTATAAGYLSFALVPEPSTALLIGMGLVAMSAARRHLSTRLA